MTAAHKNKQSFAWLALCALFITVSFAASLHFAEHDATAPQGKVCSVCVTAVQLGAAVPASDVDLALDPAGPDHETQLVEHFATKDTPSVRQRGPPRLS